MSRDEYIDYLAGKLATGEIDFERIRKELQKQGLGEADTKSMIRLIDDEIRWRDADHAKRQQASLYIFVGTLLTIAGLISTIFFIGLGPVVYFIGYGPFTAGLTLIFTGRRIELRTSRIANQRGSKHLRDRMNY